MKKVILYIAMSLDGYIADENGGVGWLGGENPDHAGDYGYSDFIKNIDTVVMGKRTYQQIVTELSPDEWVYQGMKTYVVTHHLQAGNDEIVFTGEPAAELVRRLRAELGKDIWICGGASLANQLMEADEIDEYHITVMPVLLGNGIRLFEKKNGELRLCLLKSRVENGVLDCVYVKRQERALTLRPYRAEDCAAIAQWIKDARAHALWCANLMPYPFDEDSFERVRMEGERRWGYKSFVVTADGGERIGYFRMNRNPQDHSAFLGFVIVNDTLRGKGYGAEMLKLIKEYAFSVMEAEKIVLRVFDVNEAAVRCYRKAGFSVTEHTAADFSFQKEKWGRFVMEAYRKM